MKSTGILLILFLILSFLIGKNVYSQQYAFKNITTNDGLTDNNIVCIYPHPNGLIYLGTGSGLDVFDGNNVFKINTGNSQAIINILPYHKDSLILVKQNSAAIINVHNYQYRLVDYSDSIRNVMNYAVKAGNYIYASSEDGMVQIDIPNLHYKNISKDFYSIDGERFSSGLPSICFSPNTNRVYMGHRNGILAYDIAKNQFIHTDSLNESLKNLIVNTENSHRLFYADERIYFKLMNGNLRFYDEKTDSFILSKNNAYSYFMVTENNVFFANKNKVIQYDKNFRLIDTIHFDNETIINFITINNKNTIYVGSKSGLKIIHKIIPKSKEFIYDNTNKISHPDLQEIFRYQNKIFLNFREGMMSIDTLTSKMELIKIPENIIFKGIFSVFYYQKNILCLTGMGGYIGFDLNTEKYVKLKFFSDSMEQEIQSKRIICGNYDSINNHIVLCPYRSAFFVKDGDKEYRWNGNDFNWFRTVKSLLYLGNYNYIFGANGSDGVMKYNFKTKNGKYYSSNSFAKSGVASPVVNKMIFRGNTLLVATNSGLAELDTATGNINKIFYENNAFNEYIYHIAKINEDYFVTTRFGISVLKNNKMYELYHFENGAATGLPFLLDGKLSFFNGNKFIQFLDKKLPQIKPVFITHISINKNLYNLIGKNKIDIDYTENEIRLYWSNDNAEDRFSNKIFYKFNNQSEWNQLNGTVLNIDYNGYGNKILEYFTVQYGRSSQVKTLEINIKNPWWATYWFYAFLVLVFLGIIYFSVKWSKHKNLEIKRKELALVLASIESERTRIGKDFHDGIGPNLSSIKLIGEILKENNKDKNSEKIAQIIDQTITDIRHVINELSPDVLKSQGLEIAIQNFLDGFYSTYPNINFDLDSIIGNKRFKNEIEINLYRICQESVNNALKYAKCDEIIVFMAIQNHEFKLEISDNGIGISSKKTKGHGLQNIKSRVEILKGNFEIKNEGGTKIIISIPLEG